MKQMKKKSMITAIAAAAVVIVALGAAFVAVRPGASGTQTAGTQAEETEGTAVPAEAQETTAAASGDYVTFDWFMTASALPEVWDLGEFMETYMPDSHIFTDYPEDVKNEVIRRYGGWYFYSSHIVSDDAAEIWGYPEGTEDYYNALKYSDQFSIFINAAYAEQLGVDVKSIDTEEKLLDL